MTNLLYISSSRIGDAVLGTGALKHMIDTTPGLAITIATDPLPAPLFKRVPGLNNLILFKKQPYKKHWVDLWEKLVPTSWDTIIDLRGSVIPWLLRSKKRHIWHSKGKTGHQVEKVAQCLNLTHTPDPFIWLSSHDLHKAEQLMGTTLPVLALSPAANWMGKQWPLPYFQALLNQFLKTHSAKIAIFAAPHERSMVQPLIDALPPENIINLVGSIDLLTVAACLKKCSLFLGNDSGLMHISAAVGTPTLGLFGPTNEREYGPWGPKNAIIRTPQSREEILNLPHFSWESRDVCYMDSLSVECVWSALNARWRLAI